MTVITVIIAVTKDGLLSQKSPRYMLKSGSNSQNSTKSANKQTSPAVVAFPNAVVTKAFQASVPEHA